MPIKARLFENLWLCIIWSECRLGKLLLIDIVLQSLPYSIKKTRSRGRSLLSGPKDSWHQRHLVIINWNYLNCSIGQSKNEILVKTFEIKTVSLAKNTSYSLRWKANLSERDVWYVIFWGYISPFSSLVTRKMGRIRIRNLDFWLSWRLQKAPSRFV